MPPRTAQDAPWGVEGDDMAAQAVLARIGWGADRAVSLSTIAEQLGWSRRAVEVAAQALVNDSRHPLVAGRWGYYLANSPDELTAYMGTLRHRALEILRRYRGVKRVRNAMRETEARAEQLVLVL